MKSYDVIVIGSGAGAIISDEAAAQGLKVALIDKGPLVGGTCLNTQMVLGNKMVFGTVSSNRGHFERSVQSLASMEQKWPGWLSRLITRRLTLGKFRDAFDPAPDNIKTVIELT